MGVLQSTVYAYIQQAAGPLAVAPGLKKNQMDQVVHPIFLRPGAIV